ncbi:hypothetical protein JZ751_014854 [Albula glossodonta]|uniref:Rho guanine nucleotide exchange factor 19 n=1 Tax=Albula glossodonta TaxID=121402 RepID=A0A8T2MXA0_9TELE|nr:hypothetical protein JZ751_014854 [Albula glossodonta]
MLPGYGFSPFPDFQPHFNAFLFQGNSPNMWIPGSPESQALSEAQNDRQYLRHRHHIAVCKQESLAFFDLPQPNLSSLDFTSLDRECLTPPPDSRKLVWTDSGAIKSDNRGSSDVPLDTDCWPHGVISTNTQGGGESGSTPNASLTLPLTLPPSLSPCHPLSTLLSDRESVHSQQSRSSTSSLGSEVQGTDMCLPQRRTSQGSLKEKSIRRKMRVYSPESLSDESLSSPSVDSEFLFPGPCETFSEEEEPELVPPELPTSPCPSPPTEGAREPLSEPYHKAPGLAVVSVEDRKKEEGMGTGGGRGEGAGGSPVPAGTLPRTVDQERRRFSASELISRLQLSQRKSSFTLKLGKSLSARVASRDRQAPRSLSPDPMLYQEYSDVAINREILRKQGAESSIEEVDHGETTPPGSLSPTSSFRSSQGSIFSLWQDIPDVRTSGQLHSFSDEERKLQEAKFELVTSEASYVRSLAIVLEHFMLSQELSECLGAQERQWLFSKLPDVKDVSERFLQDLEHRLEQDILRFDVCDIVLAHCPALSRVYLPYVTNQAYQEQTYQRLLQENPRFRGILARLEEDPICQRLPLASFLILPFQRITRLKMLVENILKRTAPGSRDEDTATKAFNELKKIIKECNSSVQSMKRMEELIHLNKKIHFEGKIFPLISQSRWLVKHGELLEVDTQTMSISGSKLKLPTRPVYLHLFNDCLLLSRRKDMWRFVVFVHAKIGDLKVKDLSQKLQGITGFIFHLQLCEGPQLKHQILLKAQTESEKQRWITAMFPSERKVNSDQISVNEDLLQVLCIKSYQAVEHDELTLEKADILQAKTITNDGWVEGIRLSDGEQGWFPKTYIEEIASRSARLRNLRENDRIKCATQKLEELL